MDTLMDFLRKLNGSMRLGGVWALENLRISSCTKNLGDNISTDQVNYEFLEWSFEKFLNRLGLYDKGMYQIDMGHIPDF